MAESEQPVVKETPKKRKRKTELERLQESQASEDTATSAAEYNPWTDREDLEVLRIHRDYHSNNTAKARTDRLNNIMSRIRTSQFQPQKPGRTADEFKARVRDLQKDEVEIEDLEAKCFLPEPSKKKQKQKAGGK